MSPRVWQDRVRDILDSITEIQDLTRAIEYEFFRKDIRSIRAVEMNLIIIGESASHIPMEIEQKYPGIPWELMRAMRNRIVHVYFQVDEKLLWDTIQNDLAPLVPLLEGLLH